MRKRCVLHAPTRVHTRLLHNAGVCVHPFIRSLSHGCIHIAATQVWDMAVGNCVQSIEHAHSRAITQLLEYNVSSRLMRAELPAAATQRSDSAVSPSAQTPALPYPPCPIEPPAVCQHGWRDQGLARRGTRPGPSLGTAPCGGPAAAAGACHVEVAARTRAHWSARAWLHARTAARTSTPV